MAFTSDNLQDLLLLSCNNYLTNSAETKYNDFASKDPFPQISDALLNYIDISMYALTTGMLDPFIPEKLTGVTYTCCFSGKYARYNRNNQMETKELADDETLQIRPNSITYLEIGTYFRVPHYMVFRFNLKVHNVYKGLLLGTGPIVDPGYKGKIFIPLHNLTANTYIIKKGADLISVEFTKLDRDNNWAMDQRSALGKVIKGLNFSSIPKYAPNIPEDRPIETYIRKALQGDVDFYKKDKEKIGVVSSMDDLSGKVDIKIEEVDTKIKEVDTKIKEVTDQIKDYQKRERILSVLSIISIIALLLTAVSMFITAGWYFKNAQALNETNSIMGQYGEAIVPLQDKNLQLQIDNLPWHSDLLVGKSVK